MKMVRFIVLGVCLTAGAVLFTMTKATAFATVAVNLSCDKDSGFLMDPNVHKRFGFVTSLNGFGLTSTLPADLIVTLPFTSKTNIAYAPVNAAFQVGNAGGPATAKVVGVISSIEWKGDVGDAIKVTMYVSQQNATQIKSLQQGVLKNAAIKSLGFWVADYDQEKKLWYEQFYPLSAPAITGVISGKGNPDLDVDLTPVPARSGINVNVYKVLLSVVPAANVTYDLHLANSASEKMVKQWGVVVGTLANPPKN